MSDNRNVNQILNEWEVSEAAGKEWGITIAPGREADDLAKHLKTHGMKARVEKNVRGAAALGVHNVYVLIKAVGKVATLDGFIAALKDAVELSKAQESSIRKSNSKN